MRILLIEDDIKLAERTAEYLRNHRFEVEVVHDGEAGLHQALRGAHDVILLDLMLPKLEGLEVCKQLRAKSSVPVIMLTARAEEVDRVLGLEMGADDYLVKPFSPRELVARIRAVLRRGQAQTESLSLDSKQVGPMRINRKTRRVDVNQQICTLTSYQFDILWVLADARDQVLTRKQLYRRVRSLRGETQDDFDPSIDRSIDVHLSKIRQALAAADPQGEQLIQTIRGVGYMLASLPL